MAGKKVELKKNALGRLVPTVVNGKKQVPYKGVDDFVARGRQAAPPPPWRASRPCRACVARSASWSAPQPC